MRKSVERLEALLGKGAVAEIDVPGSGGLPLALPENEAELVETLRLAASERWVLVPVGLGSKLSWRRPARADLALSTRRMAGVIAYEPGDGTLTARAGTVMADLERVAREGGNHLTPRVPAPGRATLGGVLAAGQSGIDRLRYGPSRHHVLGMRVALADGVVAKSGGRLVKNVTGYDVHRLHCGSHGTLCVVLEATLRLFAGFDREVLLTAPAADRAAAIASARRAAEIGVLPLLARAENVLDPGGSWRVHVLFAGRAAVVDWAARALVEVLPGASEGGETIERLRDAELGEGRWSDLRISGRPSLLARELGRLGERARAIVDPSVASADLFLDAAETERLAREMLAAGLEVRVHGSRPDLDGAPAGTEIMRRLKSSLDPEGVFAGAEPQGT